MPERAPAPAWQADYSPIADFYQRHWCSHYHPWALRMLERLLLGRLRPGSRVLDLCCGTGTLMSELRSRGFEAAGLDVSPGMLAAARRCLPDADLLLADARDFRWERPFDAVVSTFDSLNHLLSTADLQRAFRCVRSALKRGGRFVFDLTTDEAFLGGWQQTCAVVRSEEAFFVRGRYDPRTRLGRTHVTTFVLRDGWRRTDVQLLQRCYSVEEVRPLLTAAGFEDVRTCVPAADPDTDHPLARGRVFFIARIGRGPVQARGARHAGQKSSPRSPEGISSIPGYPRARGLRSRGQ